MAKALLRKLITKYLLLRLEEQCTLLVSRNTSQILRHMHMKKQRFSITNYCQYTGTPRSRVRIVSTTQRKYYKGLYEDFNDRCPK